MTSQEQLPGSPPSGTTEGPGDGAGSEAAEARPVIDPQRLLRIASVTREVLEEARRIKPEPSALEHLADVHRRICKELSDSLPPELYEELNDLTPEIRSGTLEELALAHAEILGWLEGLFQGTQLALQMQAARALYTRGGGSEIPGGPGGPGGAAQLPPGGDPGQGPREQDPRYL